MKNFLILILAAAISGLVCFAIMHWGFNQDYDTSLTVALSVGITGIVVEYLKPYILKSRNRVD